MTSRDERDLLVYLASGVGNIVFATPLLMALRELGLRADVALDADYPQTAELLAGWHAIGSVIVGDRASPREYPRIIPAIPPFYWRRFARRFVGIPGVVRRPDDALFYRDEQEYYLSFAHALGYDERIPPWYALPVAPDDRYGVGPGTVVLAPGCKTGEMKAKRWPHFPLLAERFEDVVLVGVGDDLDRHDGSRMIFPGHVRSFVDRLTLRETAGLLASAGVVVGNDSGLSHVAGAVGAPTVILFGPTPDRTLGRFPTNVHVLRAGLACEPCWFSSDRFRACAGAIRCLAEISAESVEHRVRWLLGECGDADI